MKQKTIFDKEWSKKLIKWKTPSERLEKCLEAEEIVSGHDALVASFATRRNAVDANSKRLEDVERYNGLIGFHEVTA